MMATELMRRDPSWLAALVLKDPERARREAVNVILDAPNLPGQLRRELLTAGGAR
jgi:hypothetical protein